LSGPPVDDQVDDWQPLARIAVDVGVSRQALHKQATAWIATGRLPHRGEGRALRIHRPTLDALRAATHNPAQDLRNRHQRPAARLALAAASPEPGKPPRQPPSRPAPLLDEAAAAPEPPATASPPLAPANPQPLSDSASFDAAAAKEKMARAEMAEIELARRRGELIPARDVEAAAIACGEQIAQAFAALKSLSGALYAAGRTQGEDGVRAVLTQALADQMIAARTAFAVLAGQPAETQTQIKPADAA
jgi:hypothetical protein